MNARITKATLAAQNEVLRARVAQLEAQLEAERSRHQQELADITSVACAAEDEARSLRGQLAYAHEQHNNVTEVASALNTMRTRPQYEMPQWQRDRKAAMEAARAAAMTQGRTIRVATDSDIAAAR